VNFPTSITWTSANAGWSAAQVYLLDDSGPLLESRSFESEFVANWFSNWRLDLITDPLCGQACRSDLSLLASALAAAYPGDRMALTSSVQDFAVRDLYGLSATDFETALFHMVTDRLAPTAAFRYFLTSGEEHAQLVDPAAVSEGGVSLLSWLEQFVNDAPGWASVEP